MKKGEKKPFQAPFRLEELFIERYSCPLANNTEHGE